MSKNKKDFVEYLNKYGENLKREEWIIKGKNRFTGRQNYGVMLKRYDPVQFEAMYKEWLENN